MAHIEESAFREGDLFREDDILGLGFLDWLTDINIGKGLILEGPLM